MIKISVIIPVYNVEKYLERCLESVINQTLKDIEIICINDCSTDNSLGILKSYASKDERIKIVDFKKNKGVSVARNKGIDKAQGEYIGFVDSDDFIDLDFYEKLYDKVKETGADCAKGNYKDELSGINFSFNKKIKQNKTNFLVNFCSAIYKREIIKDYKVKFPKLSYLEDPVFTLFFAQKINKIEIVDDAIVYITKRKDSACANLYSFQSIKEQIKGLDLIFKIMSVDIVSNDSYSYVTTYWLSCIFNNIVDTNSKKIQQYGSHRILEIFNKYDRKRIDEIKEEFIIRDEFLYYCLIDDDIKILYDYKANKIKNMSYQE